MEHVKTGLPMSPRRLIVGITGASGAIYGVQLLEALHARQVETHLVITEAGCTTLALETGRTPESLEPLVARRYAPYDFTAAIASAAKTTELITTSARVTSARGTRENRTLMKVS